MIGNHFKKKFSKIPPPGIVVTEVVEKEFSENSFLTTSVTIIPGGGLLLNFFLKWFPIIVLPTITIAMIRKNTNIIEIVFVDLFIFFLN